MYYSSRIPIITETEITKKKPDVTSKQKFSEKPRNLPKNA